LPFQGGNTKGNPIRPLQEYGPAPFLIRKRAGALDERL
jgi:hypothetical protein